MLRQLQVCHMTQTFVQLLVTDMNAPSHLERYTCVQPPYVASVHVCTCTVVHVESISHILQLHCIHVHIIYA